jgi:zinc transporter ZupT
MHNIPFGVEITAMLNENKSKKQMWIYITLLTLSTFFGGLLVFIFSNLLSDFVLGSMLSITMGMILYLVFGELLTELKEGFNKYSLFGLLIGILLMLIGVAIE